MRSTCQNYPRKTSVHGTAQIRFLEQTKSTKNDLSQIFFNLQNIREGEILWFN